MLDGLAKTITKMTPWSKVIAILLVLLILILLYNSAAPVTHREGFVQNTDFVVKRGPEALDEFYVNIYDDLLFSQAKNDYEIGQIINSAGPTSESIILDVGSGTGHHVGALQKKGFNARGVDLSPVMVAKASENYPDVEFKSGNVLDTMLYPAQSFTHVLCLYFTIYQIEDKKRFLQNAYNWLMPGGMLVLHLVDRTMFDPIVPAAASLMAVSPQKYADKRITESTVVFDNMRYKASFVDDFANDTAIFQETFQNKDGESAGATGKARQNEHVLYMPTQKSIINAAKDVGFIMIGKADLLPAGYEYQYLYMLQKPE